MTDGYHRFAFAEAGHREIGEILEVLTPSLNLDAAPLGEGPVEIDLSLRKLKAGTIFRRRLSNLHVARTAAHGARDGNDDLLLILGLSGAPIGMTYPGRRHGRQEQAIRPFSSPALLSYDEVSTTRIEASDLVAITMPRERLAPFVADLDDAVHRGVQPSPALTLLTGHATMLAADIGPMDAACAAQASDILRDLFCLALGPTREGAAAARDGARSARLMRIKIDIHTHRTNPDLSLEWLAKRHSLGPRQIQALFYMTGEGYSDFLRNARLDHARSLLSEPANAGRTVAEIAFDSGFGDLSWFNASFRRRFGMTPSEARGEMRRKNPL